VSRDQPALGRPPAVLTGFPRWRLTRERTIFRAHRRDRPPWWFSSDLSGRFDLIEPDGTCYVAATPATALRERWGERLVRLGRVTISEAEATAVSQLSVPHAIALADTCSSGAAAFRMTREIGVLTPYSVPQAWAAGFAEMGLRGVRYEAQFSTGPRDLAYAVFGAAGASAHAVDPSPLSARETAAAAGITVIAPPYSLPTIRPAG
jgi:hypothetical protein